MKGNFCLSFPFSSFSFSFGWVLVGELLWLGLKEFFQMDLAASPAWEVGGLELGGLNSKPRGPSRSLEVLLLLAISVALVKMERGCF